MTPSGAGSDPAAFELGPAPQESDPAEALRRRVYMGFAAIVAVGLALAGLYIGGRLFARPKPLQEPLVVAAVAHPAPLPAEAASVSTLITPQVGEKYLQLAALGPGCTERYVKELEAKGIHVSVAPGPSETIHRVVVGPFADRSELERQRDVLEAAGIQSMLRIY